MYVYKGECRHCGGELIERFIGRWDEDAVPADCSDCDGAESLVFLDETVGDLEKGIGWGNE